MFLVVGLGNPGEEYAKTRHNIGFMAADEIYSRYNFSPYKAKFGGLIAEGNIDGIKTLLLKPQTFMNLSGNSVGKVAAFYKIPPENIIVIHDDKDLALGKLKAKIGGSAGGHNGLKNIDSQIGKTITASALASVRRRNIIQTLLTSFYRVFLKPK